MEKTVVLTNFKNYPQSTLLNAETLLSRFAGILKPPGMRLVYSVSPVDLGLSRMFRDLEIFSQHADHNDPGAATGKITMEGLANLGIKGSLLNHSENRIGSDLIEKAVVKSRKIGFEIVLCVESPEEAEKYAPLKPSFIAYEPPELIGGDISVSTSRPEIISEVVSICDKHDVNVMVGAGVKNRGDLLKSLELGARGVLIASGIVKAKDPVASLNSLISS